MIPHAYLLPSRHLRSRRHTSRRRRSPYLVEGLRARSPFSPLPFPLSTPFPAIRDGLAWKADQPVGRRLLHPRATRSIRDSLFSLYLSRFRSRSRSPSLSIILYLILSHSLVSIAFSLHPRRTAERLRRSQQQPAAASNRQKRARLAVRFEAVFLLLCRLPFGPPSVSSARSHSLPLSLSLVYSCSPTLPSLARPAAVPLVCRRERSFMVL